MFSIFLERYFLKDIKVEKCTHLSCKEKPSGRKLAASDLQASPLLSPSPSHPRGLVSETREAIRGPTRGSLCGGFERSQGRVVGPCAPSG